MPRIWLVTGSSRGLGRALCEEVLARKERLLATARNIDSLRDLEISHPDLIRTQALDVTDPAAADAAVRRAIAESGGLDVLVNNAGYGDVGSVEDTELASFRRQIETNLFGTIIMTKAAIPLLRAQRRGVIIQLSSVGGRLGAPGRAAYSAAKWGVEGFSEALAKEMALIGVRVHIVEPGGFRTHFAGSSTHIAEGRPEYDAVVGQAARMQREYNGRQPGDPTKAARVIVKMVAEDLPMLRIALGSDALAAISQAANARMEELNYWRSISESTDYTSDAPRTDGV